jgi:hypothetical protein
MKHQIDNPFLTKEQLEKLPTKRILAYKKSKRFYLYGGYTCSCGYKGCDIDTYYSRNPEMEKYAEQLKKDIAEVLAERNHAKKLPENNKKVKRNHETLLPTMQRRNPITK